MGKSTGYTRKASLLFKSRLDKAIESVILNNLGIRKDERFLIVYDSTKAPLAERFKNVASSIVEDVVLMRIPQTSVDGQEPSAKASKALLECDAAIILTSRSISHTKARRNATAKGVRMASMPGITEEIMKRSVNIDYSGLKKRIEKVGSLLDKAKYVNIKTSFGTDIYFSISGRKSHGLSAGMFNTKGKWGNLPEGESYIAPVEGSANGVFVVDGSIAGIGKIKHPVIFFVRDGMIEKITNGKKPLIIEDMMSRIGTKARNIAEFGIGLNNKARVTGIVLEDEKAIGTCHIALGNNIGFGGKVDVPFHVDCVIRKPSIWLDNKRIMKNGKLLV